LIEQEKRKKQISTEQSLEYINFIDLYNIVKKRKRFIYLFTGLVTLIAIIYSLLATPFYKSYVSIYPTFNDNSAGGSFGDIQGIATAFGFNVDGEGVSFYIPDIVQSRRLKKAVILKKWKSSEFEEAVDLITFWEINDPTKLKARIKKFIGKFLPKKKGDPQKIWLENALEKIDNLILVKEEDSGLTNIIISMEEPQLAADIVNYIAQYIKNYIGKEQGMQFKKNRQFIEDRLAAAKDDLSESEEDLTLFRKDHPITFDTPDLQLLRGRFFRSVEVNQEVYITLRQQYELAKIDELKEMSIINILDEGEAPVFRDKPKRKLIVILSLFVSLFIGVVLAVLREIVISDKK